ncbi:F-box/WD repeat-containing protein 7-like isoform X1 [Amphibalanus amphitrite]|uniref:F-box/WD repeat-containing protein 7-like isoform X1 n=1 Tax=Amphibalanus amphitrite TaxID=1232801 RepID=UPI001C925BC7|nr:F-box/WD repeat-containing protein 7-like isoform X1 [Amphibalanus amphitrite]
MGFLKAFAAFLRRMLCSDRLPHVPACSAGGWLRSALCCSGPRHRRHRSSACPAYTDPSIPVGAEDLTELLPDELLLELLDHLSAADRCRAAATCRRWHRLAADPLAWRRCHRRLHLPPMSERESRLECVSHALWCRERPYVTVNGVTTDCQVPGDSVLIDWSAERALMRTSSGAGEVWSTEGHGLLCTLALEGESGCRGSLVLSAYMFGERAVTLDGNMEIRVWCLRSHRLIQILKGHGCPVISMDMDEYLVTGGAEQRLGVWRPDSGRCGGLLDDHEPAPPVLVRCSGRRAISADWYGRALIWDLPKARCIRQILTGRYACDRLSCAIIVALNRTHAVIAEHTGRVHLLNVDTGAHIKQLVVAERRLFAVALDDRTLAVAGASGSVRLWSLHGTPQLLFRVSVFMAGSYRTVLRQGLLFVQSDTLVQVYDVERRRLVQTLTMPPLARRKLSVERNKVMSVTYRGRRKEEMCFHLVKVHLGSF